MQPQANKYKLSKLPYGDEYFFEVRGLRSEFAKDAEIIKLNTTCSVKTEEGGMRLSSTVLCIRCSTFVLYSAPDKPEDFRVVPKNKEDIAVSWKKPYKTKGEITAYIIQYQMLGAKSLEKV